MINKVIEIYGMLDILVNNVGIMDNFVLVGELIDEFWDKVFVINIIGVMWVIRKVFYIFEEKG